MNLVYLILIVFALQIAWAVFKEGRPFDREIAGVKLTVDPKTKSVRCHTYPTDEQLTEITRWVEDSKLRRSHWSVIEKL